MLAARAVTTINPNLTKLNHRRFTGDGILGGAMGGSTLRGRSIPMIQTTNPTTTHLTTRVIPIKAVINSGDRQVKSTAPSTAPPSTIDDVGLEIDGPPTTTSTTDTGQVRAMVVLRNKMREKLLEKMEGLLRSVVDGMGQGILIQLISEEVDPATRSGKLVESYVRQWAAIPSEQSFLVRYFADFTLPKNFGKPGAILITNNHRKEFYLVEIVLENFDGNSIVFPAHSWIQPSSISRESRIFFANQTYLPSQTPQGIKDLRHEDLMSMRGDGKGERKLHERIYDYAPYNDLGIPEKEDRSRPVLAGEERPYPRRCRTGRLAAVSNLECEMRVERPDRFYVPRDEDFEEIKHSTFSAGRLKGLMHNLLPQIAATLANSDVPFTCFSDIDKLYNDGFVLKDEHHHTTLLMQKLMKSLLRISNKLLKYDTPAIIQRDRFAWLRDDEFARQALAGVNPVSIELLKVFPIVSKLDPAIYGPPQSAITKELLEEELFGMNVEEAIKDKRLFMIDYHDLLLPFVNKINSLPDRKCYATRTVFYLSNSGVLKPVAIELALPATSSSEPFRRVYTHGHSATAHWLWNQAKAHACAVDGGIHQLAHHWLRTHACMEPYIIATHRHLSRMHPIFKLLQPHMRYTMEINSLARQGLINGGGIIEACFTPGEYAMEISSAYYKSLWRFDMEALPADLIRRGMAEEDPSSKTGVKLLIEDYPYAADGLLIWSAIKEGVESYVSHFYPENSDISSDVELHKWWHEIRIKGHTDKRNERWWPQLKTKEDLVSIVTTMIWTASGQHAAINFGQYPFGGYVPNRPTIMRKLIPQEDDPEYEKFLLNPQQSFLTSLPTQLQATKVMAVQETLSTHSADEEYLGQVSHLHRNWVEDEAVMEIFDKFSQRIKEVEEIIHHRNRDPKNLNRTGAGIPPYELLLPTSDPGVTGRGIPNSISI